MLVLFHEHKKIGFRKTKVFEKNTTRMVEIFFKTYKGLTLVFRKEPVNTFAPEIRQKHTGSLNTKMKGKQRRDWEMVLMIRKFNQYDKISRSMFKIFLKTAADRVID
jgi:hypothetical protein